MNETKPNLFKYATSELSQDAFLCWFLEWADPKHGVENPLHKAAHNFIFKLSDGKIQSVEKLEILRQYKKIDILVKINDTDILLIEDKVHALERKNQLKDYKGLIETDFLDKSLTAIYLKTGDQSGFSAANLAGFKVFLRRDLLNVLDYAIEIGVKNDILNDFRDKLHSYESDVQSYKTLKLDDWIYESWIGFYNELSDLLKDGGWGHVNQVNGGFLCFTWNSNFKKTELFDFEYYPQLEQHRLRIKIIPYPFEKANEIRDYFRNILFEKASEFGINIHRNGRIGKTMTVAECSDEYRKTDKNGLIDMQATVEYLKKIGQMINNIN
jgi:hypothetical protein